MPDFVPLFWVWLIGQKWCTLLFQNLNRTKIKSKTTIFLQELVLWQSITKQFLLLGGENKNPGTRVFGPKNSFFLHGNKKLFLACSCFCCCCWLDVVHVLFLFVVCCLFLFFVFVVVVVVVVRCCCCSCFWFLIQPIVLVFVFVLAIFVFVFVAAHLSLVVSFWGGVLVWLFACFCFCFPSDAPKIVPLQFHRGVVPSSLSPNAFLQNPSFHFVSFVPLGLVSSCYRFLHLVLMYLIALVLIIILFFFFSLLFFFHLLSFLCSLPIPFQTILHFLVLGLGQSFCSALLMFDGSSVSFWYCLFLLLVMCWEQSLFF